MSLNNNFMDKIGIRKISRMYKTENSNARQLKIENEILRNEFYIVPLSYYT